MVEQAQRIGGQVDGAADGRGFGPELEDLDLGHFACGCEFGEREGGRQARHAAAEDDDVQAVGGCWCHFGRVAVVGVRRDVGRIVICIPMDLGEVSQLEIRVQVGSTGN